MYLLIKITKNPRRTKQQSGNLSFKFVEKKEHWTKPTVLKWTICSALLKFSSHRTGMPSPQHLPCTWCRHACALLNWHLFNWHINRRKEHERTMVHRNAQAFESKLPQVEWASSCPSQTKSGFRVRVLPSIPTPRRHYHHQQQQCKDKDRDQSPSNAGARSLLLIFLSSSKARASRTTCMLQDT